MRRIADLFVRRGLESEEERRERIKKIKISIGVMVLLILVVIAIPLIYMYSQQIDGKPQILPNDSLLSMGSETNEDRTIEVSSANSLYNYEMSVGDLAKEFFTKQKTIELLNSMYGVISDIKYMEDVGKTREVAIPKGATYLPVNKKGINEITYSTEFGSSLGFNLLNMDIEMYSWKVNYKINSGKEIKEVYVIMILDNNMLLGKTCTERKPGSILATKGAMEVISYQISEQ